MHTGGASGYRPENSMEAFRYAWEQGINHIECDLRYTKDHRIVILHTVRIHNPRYKNNFVTNGDKEYYFE